MDALDLYFADLHAPKTEQERTSLAALMAASREGHLCVELDYPIASPYVRNVGRLYYLEKNFTYETRLLEKLQELSFVKRLDFQNSDGLNPEQQQALELVLTHTLSIIEGGPGTGKTFLTSHLVRALGGGSCILAAPTGKAAARLKEFNPNATCGTLHSLLGYPFEKHPSLKADLIIVDESSMIDAKLFSTFLNSLEKGQRVVFLGDSNQLPPVESGSLFRDLVDLLPTAHLRTCLRSDRSEILQLANDILLGKPIQPHHGLSQEFVLQKALEGYTILSPIREGPFGVNALNEKIFDYFYRKSEGPFASPILITRTDYDAKLYNGEMGRLWRTREKILYAEFQDRKIAPHALAPYELGYVLSVHKSQGSEFDHCLVLIPPGSESFGREVLYTAVTRAKQSIILCGDAETIKNTVNHSSRRLSGLRLRFNEKVEK